MSRRLCRPVGLKRERRRGNSKFDRQLGMMNYSKWRNEPRPRSSCSIHTASRCAYYASFPFLVSPCPSYVHSFRSVGTEHRVSALSLHSEEYVERTASVEPAHGPFPTQHHPARSHSVPGGLAPPANVKDVPVGVAQRGDVWFYIVKPRIVIRE